MWPILGQEIWHEQLRMALLDLYNLVTSQQVLQVSRKLGLSCDTGTLGLSAVYGPHHLKVVLDSSLP
jgi:hypothetical protein